jgi:serine/threonine-protein kinase
VRDDHVIAIHAVSDDGVLRYLVMEFIAGMTLQDRIKHGGAFELPVNSSHRFAGAERLGGGPRTGLIHRDIKPANILLENSVQRVKITDFGLAGVAADAGPTEPGCVAGTPPYMSPEQARGEPTDFRTDLFSLGSVLYTLSAGRPPFLADTTAEVLRRVRADAPRPVREINPDVPEWLCGLISSLHANEASAWPASAREVADLLSRRLALLQQPPLAPADEPESESPKPSGAGTRPAVTPPTRLAVLCLIGVLLALTAVAVYGKWRQTPAPDTGPQETRPIRLDLGREDIPPQLLALPGAGDPAKAPPQLAAVLGDPGFLLARIGSILWMQQSRDEKVLAVPVGEELDLAGASGSYRCPRPSTPWLSPPTGTRWPRSATRRGRSSGCGTWAPRG